ncbi:MAG TPA: NAD(P)H-binding protein [Streptosporangiaceae bacterium]
MIVITGAGGALFGRPVLDALLKLVPADRIIAGSRSPGQAAWPADVRVRRLDFDDADSLAAGFAGARTVLVNGTNYGTPPDHRRAQHARALRAAVAAGAARIVYTTWPDPDRSPLPSMADFAESEALLRGLPVDWTILRTTYGLAQTVGRDVTTAIATGVLAAPAEGARTTPAHIDDLAEATARVLASDGHAGRRYTLTAADTVDWPDLARLASRIAGRPIAYRPISDDAFTDAMRAQGVPDATAELLLAVYQAFRQGWTADPAPDLGALLGRAPRTAIDAVAAVTG